METSSDHLIPAAKICARYGRTDRTLDRWLKDESLKFPRPVVIRNRRYFKEAEIIAWEQNQAANARAA